MRGHMDASEYNYSALYKDCVLGPCRGSGGMFVTSKQFVEENSGRMGGITVYGREALIRSIPESIFA